SVCPAFEGEKELPRQSHPEIHQFFLEIAPNRMPQPSDSLKQLTEELSKLPGIGHKSAQRLALHFLKVPKDEVLELAHALVSVKEKMRFCTSCWTFTETDPCAICKLEDLVFRDLQEMK